MPELMKPVFGSPVSLIFRCRMKLEYEALVQRKSLYGIFLTPSPPGMQPSFTLQSSGGGASQPSSVLPSKSGLAFSERAGGPSALRAPAVETNSAAMKTLNKLMRLKEITVAAPLG